MSDTPLNPDARRAAFEAVQAIDGPASIGTMEVVDVAVSAYLAAAQPEVKSVEELDALPAGSLVRSGGREFYKTSYIDLPWVLPYGVDRFASGYLAKHSKVTVIHRPEVKP